MVRVSYHVHEHDERARWGLSNKKARWSCNRSFAWLKASRSLGLDLHPAPRVQLYTPDTVVHYLDRIDRPSLEWFPNPTCGRSKACCRCYQLSCPHQLGSVGRPRSQAAAAKHITKANIQSQGAGEGSSVRVTRRSYRANAATRADTPTRTNTRHTSPMPERAHTHSGLTVDTHNATRRARHSVSQRAARAGAHTRY